MKNPFLKIGLALFPVILAVLATLYLLGLFGNSMPDFIVDRIDGRAFTRENIRADVPVVVIYVDVFCKDCNHLTEEIVAHATEFKNAQVLFISPQNVIEIRGFMKTHNLESFRQFTMLRDTHENFDAAIKANDFPTVLVYSSSLRLLRRFDYAPRVEDIILLIRNA